MSKKLALGIVLLVEAVVYLFLFVGIPAIEKWLCPTCNARELFPTPWLLIATPGLIGALMCLLIWRTKPEVKDNG